MSDLEESQRVTIERLQKEIEDWKILEKENDVHLCATERPTTASPYRIKEFINSKGHFKVGFGQLLFSSMLQ